MPGAVEVRGLRELNGAFRKISKDLSRELRDELIRAGEPVRLRAEQLSGSSIRNIGPLWKRMRVGATSRVVYVAPRSRRRRGSPRPNLAPLLAKEMEQALDEQQEEVAAGIESVLDRLSAENGF